jgi:5-methyltetrahydrofolate--homocysteine methyltransferase
MIIIGNVCYRFEHRIENIDTSFYVKLKIRPRESMMNEKTQLKEALSVCNESDALALIDRLLDAEVPADEIVMICNQGMGQLGERFDQGEAFIPDLIFGGMIMKKIMEKLKPKLPKTDSMAKGKTFVIGTVQHDVHDIGKDITAMILRGNGFNVVDLGVNVPPEKFVEAVRENRPDFLGMSVLLTTCYKSVMETMDALRNAGMCDTLKTCIGGAAASQLIADCGGIDFYGKTAVDCVNWAKQI